jgi:hypothetical protein
MPRVRIIRQVRAAEKPLLEADEQTKQQTDVERAAPSCRLICGLSWALWLLTTIVIWAAWAP